MASGSSPSGAATARSSSPAARTCASIATKRGRIMYSRWRCRDPRLIGAAALVIAASVSRPARADPADFDLAAGVLVAGGIGWLDRPTPDELTLARSGQSVRYGALSGFVFAGGLT